MVGALGQQHGGPPRAVDDADQDRGRRAPPDRRQQRHRAPGRRRAASPAPPGPSRGLCGARARRWRSSSRVTIVHARPPPSASQPARVERRRSGRRSRPRNGSPGRPVQLLAELDQLIVDRARQPRLEPRPQLDIGDQRVPTARPRWRARASGCSGPDRHPLVEIAAQAQALRAAAAGSVELDRDERHVLDLDPSALDRRHQPVAAVRRAPQHAGEQLDQRDSPDRRTLVPPGAVARDGEPERAFGCGRAAGRR